MGVLESLDNGITELVGSWNVYSTVLVTVLVGVVSYRALSMREADIHPMLLARQAVASPVRHEGESAVYRSQAAPHSMPLNSGLMVKDPGMSKWSRGRNGDLRDVWRRVADGGDEGAKGKILTVLGSENVVEHKLGTAGSLLHNLCQWHTYTIKRISPGRSTLSGSTLPTKAALGLPSTCPTPSSCSPLSSPAASTPISRPS